MTKEMIATAEAMMKAMSTEQKMALVNGESTMEEALIWFKNLNKSTLEGLKNGTIKLD